MKIKKDSIILALALVATALLPMACAVQKKVDALHKNEVKAQLSLGEELSHIPELEFKKDVRDTIIVHDMEGNDVFIMKAIKDDESGEMVATDVIDAAVVTARFRNVAERNGKVDITFQITVPKSMQDSKWQLRFNPDMFIMEDSVRLDPVIITGDGYRLAQLKGYQQYERFLSKIISDSTKFINLGQLEIFLKRNIPQIYAFKNDTTEVSDEAFYSIYGVSEQEAVEHYTNTLARSANERRKARKGLMFNKYVKAPIVTEGIRLDTVIRDFNGDFIYNYIQTIHTRPKLRKVDILLSGNIFEQDKQIYTIPTTEPLTFYISSLSTFTDNSEHYMKAVIERRAEANTACYVDFALGKSDVDLTLGYNEEEIGRIQGNLRELMRNTVYDLDSIVVVSSASPEGTIAANNRLSKNRSESISRYLNKYIKEYQDSLDIELGFNVDENGNIVRRSKVKIPFISRSDGENWSMLDYLVSKDTVLTDAQKERYNEFASISNLDEREAAMRKEDSYNYMKSTLYPRLRTVRFSFNLHRKGMIKDTIHTTVLDTNYMKGAQALRDMDYETALKLLRPYNDFNTAVACVALERNLSALEILQKEKPTPEVNYLLAIVHSRLGNHQKAVQHYTTACQQNGSYVYRGNLDPEISVLIKTYGLNKEEEFTDGSL